MSLIDEKMMQILLEWAKENEDRNIFPMISGEDDSYYIDRNSEETYMMEYSFETMAELKKVLEEYSGLSESPELLKMITIETCKNRAGKSMKAYGRRDDGREKKSEQDDKATLPEFIYVF